MNVEFWGVRGSAATPDSNKLRYGGNTTSIVLTSRAVPNHFYVLDAGTGLARFGNTLDLRESYSATVLLSHLHLYHIIGFQFTPLAFSPRCQTHVIGPSTRNIAMETVFDHIMSPSYSPVYGLANLMADVSFEEVSAETRRIHDMTISAAPFYNSAEVDSWGYRLDNGQHAIAYLTDARVRSSGGDFEPNAERLAKGVTVLIVGAFDPDHNRRDLATYADALELAEKCGIQHIYFSHHHPDATDDDLDSLQHQLNDEYPLLNAVIAAEGMIIDL